MLPVYVGSVRDLISQTQNSLAQEQLSTVAILGFQFGLYHVVAPLTFLRSISLALLFSSSLRNEFLFATLNDRWLIICVLIQIDCCIKTQSSFFRRKTRNLYSARLWNQGTDNLPLGIAHSAKIHRKELTILKYIKCWNLLIS